MSIITVNYDNTDHSMTIHRSNSHPNSQLIRKHLSTDMSKELLQKTLKADVDKDLLDYSSKQEVSDKVEQFFEHCYPKTNGGPQMPAGSYKSYLKQLKIDLLTDKTPIIFYFPSKNSTSAGQDGVKVLHSYSTFQYDSGFRHIFIDNPICVGTAGTGIDPANKPKSDEFWPDANNTEIKFTTAYCERVGLPDDFELSVTTIDSNVANPKVNIKLSCNYLASITPITPPLKNVQGLPHRIDQDISISAKKLNAGNIVKYLAGNKSKNQKISNSSTSNLDIFLYLLFKELGDYLQILLYIVYSLCRRDENSVSAPDWRTILITTDFVVYKRVVDFEEEVLHSGVRDGVTSGGAKFWYNCPTPFSFGNIKKQIKNYNINLFTDILTHNILTMNYLKKIAVGLQKLISGDKRHTKEGIKALGRFTLLIKNEEEELKSLPQTSGKKKKVDPASSSVAGPSSSSSVAGPSSAIDKQALFKVKKIYLHQFYSNCIYENDDITEPNEDAITINQEIIEAIKIKIKAEIDEIIMRSIELIIAMIWFDKTFESSTEGTYSLPSLSISSDILVYMPVLRSMLEYIFEHAQLDDNFEQELIFDKIYSKIYSKIIELLQNPLIFAFQQYQGL